MYLGCMVGTAVAVILCLLSAVNSALSATSVADGHIDRLVRQTRLAEADDAFPATVVIRFPPTEDRIPFVWPRRGSAGLPVDGLVQNPSLLLGREPRAGLYVAVRNKHDTYVFIQEVEDPRITLAESATPDGVLSPAFIVDEQGVIAAEVPFLIDGFLELFEIDAAGKVIQHLDQPLRDAFEHTARPYLSGELDATPAGVVDALAHVERAVAPSMPRLEIVYDDETKGPTVDVVFIGDGFKNRDQLESYRAAVRYLVDGLLRTSPFCHYARFTRFYRIDAIDEAGPAPIQGCERGKELPVGPRFRPPHSTPAIVPSPTTVELTLEVRQGSSRKCEFLWISDDSKELLGELVAHYPLHRPIVVVVANTQITAGSGAFLQSAAVRGIVLTGVPLEQDGDDWRFGETARRLFAHEIGHAMGLLDEYPGEAPPPAVGRVPRDRNVWFPGASLGGRATPSSRPPWSADLPRGCTPSSMVSCCGIRKHHCELCPGVGRGSADCYYVGAVCQNVDRFCGANRSSASCVVPDTCAAVTDPTSLCLGDACIRGVAAFEGAFYDYHHAYRSRFKCMMMELTPHAEFCEACLRVIHDVFCKAGCARSAPSRDDKCPALPLDAEIRRILP